ncbi:MAG: hypothetical protein WC905_00655 [Patescibacteria group bacterium]|jgi:hypothetical protein
MKKKKQKPEEKGGAYGPYSVPTTTGFVLFFIKGAESKEEADEAAFIVADKIEAELKRTNRYPGG